MIQFDRAIVVALHLRLIGVLQHFPRVRQSLLVHGPLLPLEAHAAYGTKVPEVRKAQLSFLAGVQVGIWLKPGKSEAGMQKSWNFLHQMERMECSRMFYRREIV